MPLDDDGRRYANNLFNKNRETIMEAQRKEDAQIRSDFSKRNMLISGPYVRALAQSSVKLIDLLAQARSDSLLKAYERSGLAFDDAEIQEITADITGFCNAQQSGAIHSIKLSIHRMGEAEHARVEDSLAKVIERGVTSVISRITRDLRIKRDEIILDGKRLPKAYAAGIGKEWNAFISHASEDKEEFVRPLANELENSGLSVWYDESTLKVGDSLRQAIDNGLVHSQFGIVVLSDSFFAKDWPQRELDGLVSKEVAGLKVILPVWHKISYDGVFRYSPTLAGRFAAKSSDGLEKVVKQLRDAMGL